jgi:hypothetical protein
VRRTFATAAGLLASLVLAGPAAAFTPPELFVRAQKWDTHEETGPWIPLAQAPALNFLGGYEIGYRLQESPAQYERQHVALQVTGVPDGAPTQPGNATPFCVTRAGTVGEITPVAPELQFEGLGSYGVKVSIGEETGDDDDCLSGPSSSGTFSVDVHVAPTLVGGALYLRRDRALPGDPFVGVRAANPPGGAADIQCMLGSTPLYTDPAETHPEVPEFVFPRPGTWSCAARGVADGRDGLETVTFGTPFSAPIRFDVLSVFRYRDLKIAKARTRRPRLRFLAEFPAEARGGVARVKLRRVTRCTNRGYRTRKAGTYRARFGPRRAEVRIRRPRPGFYFARFAFGGTHFLKALSKTEPLKVKVTKKRVKYVGTLEFTPC